MRAAHGRVTALVCTVAFGCLIWTSAAGQQPREVSGFRRLMSEAALPAIDRGLREQDIVRDPARRPRRPIAADGSAVDTAFVAGSVIVKFKAGADRSAREVSIRWTSHMDALSRGSRMRCRAR